MNTYILIVIMYLHNGGTIEFQEFSSLEKCRYAAETIYKEQKRVGSFGLETAYCVAK